MSEKKGIKEGPPIWVESLLTLSEWRANLVRYPSTCHLKAPPQFFKSDFEWRHGMGASLTEKEITNVNGNIAYLMETAKLKAHVDETTTHKEEGLALPLHN